MTSLLVRATVVLLMLTMVSCFVSPVDFLLRPRRCILTRRSLSTGMALFSYTSGPRPGLAARRHSVVRGKRASDSPTPACDPPSKVGLDAGSFVCLLVYCRKGAWPLLDQEDLTSGNQS